MLSTSPKKPDLNARKTVTLAQLLLILPADLAFLLLILGPALANGAIVSPLTGFVIFASSTLAGLAALIVGLWPLRRRNSKLGILSVIMGLVPLGIVFLQMAKSHSYPRLNDVSTDLDNPPSFVEATLEPENAGKDLTFPDTFKDTIREAYPALISLQIPRPASDVFGAVRLAAEKEPTFEVVRVDESALTLEGRSTSGLFHFVDDFVIRVQQLENGSQVDMRSRSRVGKGDFGANAKRIAGFFATLKGSAEEERAYLNEAPADAGN